MMVQSELVLPPIVSRSTKKCQKKRRHKKAAVATIVQSRELVGNLHVPIAASSLMKIQKEKRRVARSSSLGLPLCFSTLYRTAANSSNSSLKAINNDASRGVLPPPSLPSLSVTHKSNGLSGGANNTSASHSHSLNLPKLKLTHQIESGKLLNGQTTDNNELPYNNDFILHGTRVYHGGSSSTGSSTEETINKQNGECNDSGLPNDHSMESLQSQLKLDLPANIGKFQTGADVCSIINLCMPLSCSLRTNSNKDCESQEFIPNETQLVKEEDSTLCDSILPHVTNIKDHTSVNCREDSSLSLSCSYMNKLPGGGQIDHFNSALIQLKRVVSDSTQKKGEGESDFHKKIQSDAMKCHKLEKARPAPTFRIERQKENRHLNIIDLEKQTSLLFKPTKVIHSPSAKQNRPLTYRQGVSARKQGGTSARGPSTSARGPGNSARGPGTSARGPGTSARKPKTSTTKEQYTSARKHDFSAKKSDSPTSELNTSDKELSTSPYSGVSSVKGSDTSANGQSIARDTYTNSYSPSHQETREPFPQFIVDHDIHVGHHLRSIDETEMDNENKSTNSSTTQYKDSRHSIHQLHCISLPSDDTPTDATTGNGNKKKKIRALTGNRMFTPTGTVGFPQNKSTTAPSGKHPFQHMTPFAYYHMLRRQNTTTAAASITNTTSTGTRGSSVPPLSHPQSGASGTSYTRRRPYKVSLHHSVQSDLTIEGNCGGGGGGGSDQRPLTNRARSSLPPLAVDSSESLHVSLAKLTPRTSPVVTPSPSYRKQKQLLSSANSKSDHGKKELLSVLYPDPFNGANSRFKWKINRLQDKENLTIKREKKASK